MQAARSRCLGLCLPTRILHVQKRNAWVLKRRMKIPPEKFLRPTWISPYIVGDFIKDVNPHPEYPETYDMYDHELTKNTDDLVNPKIKVILLDNVDGVGGKGDIAVVNARTARHELILSKRAVYASDFNLKFYADMMKNKVGFERPSSLLSPYTRKDLLMSVFPVFLSNSNPWKLDMKHVIAALRQGGLLCPEYAVELPPNLNITGPDMAKQYKVLVVHLQLNKHERVPTKIMIVHTKTILKEQFTAGKLEPVLEEQRKLLASLPFIKRTVEEVEDITYD